MENYIQTLQDYIKENRITFERNSPQPCLDMLWWHFGEYHNLDNDTTREGLRRIWAQLDALAFEDSDALVAEIGALGAEYERLAFTAGLRLGVQLMLEVRNT